ncbi:hypothetical protein SAY87_005582 [Trapa incisa]|uniref:Uncharacterized protein n=1 Tax=Trapa incisa TaxID=236973 RepID=A0AAN7K6D1_9MYRT|nr:hypothetical protein SAY87_005582 [Trapa incisa]
MTFAHEGQLPPRVSYETSCKHLTANPFGAPSSDLTGSLASLFLKRRQSSMLFGGRIELASLLSK